VTFGGLPAAGFAVQTDNLLYVLTATHAPGTYHIVVGNGAGSSVITVADYFTFTGAPAVAGVFPSGGPVYGGTFVTITGSGFTGATVVTFGGVAGAGLTVLNDSQLTVFSPAHVSGAVFVAVWVGGVPSPAAFGSSFLYGGGLVVTGVSPASGPTAGGTAVTITGAGFLGAVAVTFGSSPSTSVFVQSDNQLLAIAPPHSSGTVDVVVWTAILSSAPTTADLFTYTSGLVVTGVSPSAGPASGGTTVTVSGTGFLGANSVIFGGISGTNMTVLSDSQLRVITPPHSAGAVHVVVIGGAIVSTTSAADTFTFTAAPTVDPPSRFAGRVVISGQPAPAGTIIQARIGSVVCGSSTAFASGGETRYVIDVATLADAHPGCGIDGAIVTFSIGDSVANQSGAWHNYQLNLLDLSAGAAPAAPPVPSQAPLPPNTGSFGTDSGNGGSRLWVLTVLLGAIATATGAGTLAGMWRRPAAAFAPVPAPVMPPAAGDRSRGLAHPRGSSSTSTWVTIGAVGAAAVLAGALFARKRR
jgi:hypothetical protein